MTIRRIFLPFCDVAGFAPIANAAFTLGRLFHAQVHGLFAQHLEGPAFIPQEGMNVQRVMHAIEKASRERAEQLRQTQETFTACAKGYPEVEAQFTAMDGAKADIVGSVARLADITIVGSGPRYSSDGWRAVRDGAIFGSGRPILLTPPAGLNENAFGRVVIAWKNSIEAAQAIAAAQPFFSLAKAVHLVTIGESGDAKDSLRDAEQYLQLHFGETDSAAIPPSGKNVGETLLSHCEARGGALLVMGAYSHSRWQERVFGGATEYILNEARTPVLMMH